MKRRVKLSEKLFYSAIIITAIAAGLLAWKKSAPGPVGRTVHAVQEKSGNAFFSFSDTLSAVKNLFTSNRGMRYLTQKNMALDMENQSLRAELASLNRIKFLKENESYGKRVRTAASAISTGSGFIQFYALDRGIRDGIEEGDGVFAPGGVLGRISSAGDSTCMVQLLTDVKSSISARVERSGVAGILIGAGNNMCELKYVPKEEDVQLGDVILTSELGSSFPAGIKIGEVTAVDKKSSNLSLVIRVKPYVNTNTVREVLVVRKK